MTNDNPESIFAEAAEPPEEGAATFKAEVETAGIDLYDHSAEEAVLAQEEKGDAIPIPDQPERLEAPLLNPAIQEDPAGSIREQAERAFTGTFDVGTVTVTPEERADFLRAALHDTEMVFDVELAGVDSVIRIAIPPESFTTSAGAAAAAWGKAGFNDPESDMQWLLCFQQMHAWFMVREINGTPTSWSDDFCDGIPASSFLRNKLRDPDNFEVFFSMAPVRWRMIVEAMRAAEFKYKLCLEAWQDRSFFTSAGTA